MPTHDKSPLRSLVGRPILIAVSEPWEFGESVGASPLPARILAASQTLTAASSGVKEQENLLLQVTHPFAFAGLKCEFFVGSPRHAGASIINMAATDRLSVALERASAERASSDEFFVAHRWKNEPTLYAIGTIEFAPIPGA
jgi:hypothetical protein